MDKLKKKKAENHGEILLELTGPEDCDFEELRVNRFGELKSDRLFSMGCQDHRRNNTLHLFLKVVGFMDDRAPKRNWRNPVIEKQFKAWKELNHSWIKKLSKEERKKYG